jgi:hypothetical protein
LGMHRVYNSAFMHMLRDEDNGGYRQVMKNTLTFDPQILKRYVNFMNNPDEETAVEQFGKADKYFGVVTLLSTLPGLPMFGHGQVEGYSEKYGMEYRRAYRDEKPDTDFIAYHDKVIAPLLHRRYIFADVENFLLYHFFDANGRVVEDVFAYSNRHHGEKALIIYHNKFGSTAGWIKTSTSFAVKAAGDEYLVKRNLVEGLDLVNRPGYVIFRDLVTDLEYIRSISELDEKGLYVELGAYKRHVFLDFRVVDGTEWQKIHDELKGAGAPSMQKKWDKLFGAKEEDEEILSIIKKTSQKKKNVKAISKKKSAEGREKKQSESGRSNIKKKPKK